MPAPAHAYPEDATRPSARRTGVPHAVSAPCPEARSRTSDLGRLEEVPMEGVGVAVTEIRRHEGGPSIRGTPTRP